MATASMILGIVAACLLFLTWVPVIGWFSFGTAIATIILASIALNQLNRDPTLQGRGMAITGLILGIIAAIPGLVFRVIWMGL